MNRLRVWCALLILAGTLAGLPLATQSAAYAAPAAPTANPAKPIKNERFALSGKLPTGITRPVVLRHLSGTRWVKVSTGSTTTSGAYRFTGVRTKTVRMYKVVAPKVSKNGRTYTQITTQARTVRPVGQTASLAMLPQIAQKGSTPAAAGAAKVAMDATFTPTRKGRAVNLQRLSGTEWVTVTQKGQDSRGKATFTAPARSTSGAVYVYRAATVAANGAAAKASASSRTDVWDAKFSDEFAGTSLDDTTWSPRPSGAENRHCTETSPDAVAVASGTLQLSLMRDPARAGQTCTVTVDGTKYNLSYYVNGHVGTQGTFDFTHGVAAARVKFPRGQGQHGSFWLQPTNPQSIPGDPLHSGAEIDVVEFFGDGYPGGGLAQFIHYLNADGQKEKVGGVWPKATDMLADDDAWWKNYHVFSVQWTPQRYVFRIDGTEFFRTNKGVSGIDEFLVLSLLTSDWELPKRSATPEKTTMNVDWTRVWQR